MGTLGIGIMNFTAFSLLANNNSEVDENQISFKTIDFQPHLPNFTLIYESMDQDMDFTTGSLNFHVRYLGSIRLSDPVSSDPSASEVKTIALSKSSVSSSSEANSSISFVATEVAEGKIAEVDENMENFDLGDQLKDLMICQDDTSDKSTDTWETRLELHEDDDSIFSSFSSKFDKRYQVLTIVGDNSEELNENNNPVLNPANIYRGANHLAEGETADSLASREKIRLSIQE
jgi:hypothetical protein